MDHSVIFSGRIREGMTLAEVRENFSRLFKLADQSRLDRIFSGRAMVLKDGLSQEQAEKYQALLHKAGAICDVHINAGAVPTPVAVPQPAAPSLAAATLAPMERPEPVEPAPAPASDTKDYASSPAPSSGGTTARRRERAPAANSSGMPDAVLPEKAAGLCWGGFFFNWIWGLCHGSFFGLLIFVPLIGLIVPFYYLFRGREIAWQKRRWKSVEEFNTVQRYWSIAGVVLAIISVLAFNSFMHRVRSAMSGGTGLTFERQLEEAQVRDPAKLQQMREEDLSHESDPAKRELMRKAFEQADLGRLAASPNPSPERDQARQQLIDQAPDERTKEGMRRMYEQLDAMNAAMRSALPPRP